MPVLYRSPVPRRPSAILGTSTATLSGLTAIRFGRSGSTPLVPGGTQTASAIGATCYYLLQCNRMLELEVLAAYPAEYQPRQLHYLGWAGGFSGARFWKVKCSAGQFCLRRWPAEHPTDGQLALIHAILKWAAQRGCDFVPVPRVTRQGHTVVVCGGSRWELSPWMPGKADYCECPSPAKLEAAMEALAIFHRAVADFPWPRSTSPAEGLAGSGKGAMGPSPGLAQRLGKLKRWPAELLADVRGRLADTAWSELVPWAERALGLARQAIPAVQSLVAEAANLAVRLQPCLGDVWHDHVLFSGQRVTGLVDFGSVRLDTVACDVARLLGSLVLDDPCGWQTGLVAYERVAGPLDPAQRHLVEVFDRSTVVLAPLNWIEWIFLQKRQFENRLAIAERMRQWVARLEVLVRGGGRHPVGCYPPSSGFYGCLQLP